MYQKKKKLKSRFQRDFHTHVHGSIIQNSQEIEVTQVSINRWINIMWYIYTMKYYLVLKKKEILSRAIT